MTHIELEKLKAHLRNPPIGHGHAPIDFGEKTLDSITVNDPSDAIAYHMNAHGVFHPEDLHKVE